MIAGFTEGQAAPRGVGIAYETGGDGPPVLLLHGFPQTRALWSRIAPALARRYRVVVADLRGYGASGKPLAVEDCSFRAMGADMTALMAGLGHERFHLVGHDRGARTAHRMALDAPGAIASVQLLDIVPTHLLLDGLRRDVALAYYHWFFLAQPEPFPERMILADPDAYYESCLLGWGSARIDQFDADQLAAYRTAWRDPDTVRGMCNDYRAGVGIDMEHDAADLARRIACPVHVIWGADGAMGRMYDVPATWADRCAAPPRATPVPGGHFFPDTDPEATLAAIGGFLDDQTL